MIRSRLAMICGLLCLGLVAVGPTSAQDMPKEQKVVGPTRLDWEFASRGFGPAAAKLPAGYDSSKQRYQLFVPKDYHKDKAWPMVLFISAGGEPMGWKQWQKLCEEQGIFFASPFDAGNATAAGQRTRIILDVLDDVRRLYRIDPDQTYLTGFSGGGRMSCAIAFALPEYFGGVIPVCGTNPLPGPAWQRQRIEDRFSVAFVTGEKDPNRKENEVFMAPWFEEIGIRSKLWVVPKMGHTIPPHAVQSEVYAWLNADLPRRRADAKARPKLAVTPDEAPGAKEQAERFALAADDDLKNPERAWRGVSLLHGVVHRWPKTPAGIQTRTLLKQLPENDLLMKRIEDQGPKDEVKSLTAQAKALERFGNIPKAIEAWSLLATNYANTPIATNAAENIKRLRGK
jgi:predicted esterase